MPSSNATKASQGNSAKIKQKRWSFSYYLERQYHARFQRCSWFYYHSITYYCMPYVTAIFNSDAIPYIGTCYWNIWSNWTPFPNDRIRNIGVVPNSSAFSNNSKRTDTCRTWLLNFWQKSKSWNSCQQNDYKKISQMEMITSCYSQWDNVLIGRWLGGEDTM